MVTGKGSGSGSGCDLFRVRVIITSIFDMQYSTVKARIGM